MSLTLLRWSRLRPNLIQCVRLNHVVADDSRKVPLKIPESIQVDGQVYHTDNTYNLTPKILSLLERQLLHEPFNPLTLLKQRIVQHFHQHHRKGGGSRSPLFAVCEHERRVVSVQENFDSLLTPLDHVSRSSSDTYYVNKRELLRAHTSAHQHSLIQSGLDAFLCVGDVFRRDQVDCTHYPCFHQMEGVHLFTHDQLFGSRQHNDAPLFEDKPTERIPEKQELITRDTSIALQIGLKSALESLVRDLFGADLQMRWSDAYFPFTHPSWELEIYHDGKWIEMLGCGIMEQKLLNSAGASTKVGWAFGLGLERLAMIMYKIPDIRLFWSKDNGFLNQFEGKMPNDAVTYKPISSHPQLYMDFSYWLPPSITTAAMQSDVMDVVRHIGGDLVEQVQLIDEFENKKKQCFSQCFRITYRSNERALTKDEINEVHTKIKNELVNSYGIEIR